MVKCFYQRQDCRGTILWQRFSVTLLPTCWRGMEARALRFLNQTRSQNYNLRISSQTYKQSTAHTTHAHPRTVTAVSLSFVQPQTNIVSVGSAKAKQFWSLCLLIWKWSLSLISISRWLGFKDLASYLLCISQKKHCQCVVRESCVGMKCKWMPVWSCLDNLARLRPRNPQSRLNIETLKPRRLSRSGLNGEITGGRGDYLRGGPFSCMAGHFEQ